MSYVEILREDRAPSEQGRAPLTPASLFAGRIAAKGESYPLPLHHDVRGMDGDPFDKRHALDLDDAVEAARSGKGFPIAALGLGDQVRILCDHKRPSGRGEFATEISGRIVQAPDAERAGLELLRPLNTRQGKVIEPGSTVWPEGTLTLKGNVPFVEETGVIKDDTSLAISYEGELWHAGRVDLFTVNTKTVYDQLNK